MTQISLPLGSSNSGTNDWSDVHGEDQAIVDVVNGNLDATNLAANVIGPNELTSALAEDLGVDQTSNVRRGVTAIATEETTTSTSYTTLTTPDQVANVVLPTNGLIFVMYRALWKLTGASNNASATLFLGSNQLKASIGSGAPAATESELIPTGDNYGPVFTGPGGGDSPPFGTAPSTASDSSFVTTGQVFLVPASDEPPWHPIVIEAAAGTYTISVQYHVNATAGGTLSVKERKLWVWTQGF